ncbi:MAG: hypothetical protein Tsb009_06200 [Planctomycetaceae bacterium]
MSELLSSDELWKRAKRHLRQREFPEAISALELFLQNDPSNVAALESLANAHFGMKNYDAAVQTFEQVSRLDPKQARAWVNLGAVFNRMGEFKKALDALRKGLQKDRSCPQGYYNMGLAHRGLNQLSMAVSAYREAIRLNPKMADAHQNLANVFMEMKNYRKAISHYEQALMIQPGFEKARRGLQIAQETLQAERDARNPFGRLVENADAKTQQKIKTSIRTMSEDERIQDRARVAELVTAAQKAASDLLDHFQSTLEPSLLKLNRAVSQGEGAGYSLVEAQEAFSVAMQDNIARRQLLKKTMQEFDEHVRSVRVES